MGRGQCIISGRPLTSLQFSRLVSPLTDCSAWVVIKRSPSPDINPGPAPDTQSQPEPGPLANTGHLIKL